MSLQNRFRGSLGVMFVVAVAITVVAPPANAGGPRMGDPSMPAAESSKAPGNSPSQPPIQLLQAEDMTPAADPSPSSPGLVPSSTPAVAQPSPPEELTDRSPAPAASLPGDSSRYVVSFHRGASATEEARSLRSRGIGVGRTFSAAVQGAVITATKAQAALIASSARVSAIEPDSPVSVSETQQPAPWGLDRIDQGKLPLSGTFTPPSSGAGVNAYVIDTGVLAAHLEFGGRVTAGWTAIADGRGSTDCNGHGTHVAGTIAGRTYGVAKAATVVPVRALACDGSGFYSDIIAGLDWIASHHAQGTPAVVNLSLGGPVSAVLDAAVEGVIADGVTAIVAAGNTATDACNASPARVADALTVAASDSSDRQATFSNHSTCVDLYAPGVGIQSALHTSTTSVATMNGTSMAAPHAAGAAAVALSKDLAKTPDAVTAELTAAAIPGVINNASAGTPNRLLHTGEVSPLLTPAMAERDLTGDGKADLTARDRDGVLWTYTGTGTGLYDRRIQVGPGWNVMTAISASHDLTGDGKADLTARDSNGTLWTYTGTGTGLYDRRIKVGDGWNVMTSLSAAGDLTGDGKADLTARDSNGTLWTYTGTGTGLYDRRIKVGDGWNVMTALSSAGDLTGDGKADLTARDRDGILWTYTGTGTGLYDRRIQVGPGWNVMTAISSAGDLNGDGKSDLTARDSSGILWTYTGTGTGLYDRRIQVGPGWEVMTTIS